MLEITVPSSKSATQRALVLAALCPGRSRIERPLWCDDSDALLGALRGFGVGVTRVRRDLEIEGRPRLAAPAVSLLLGNAGTAVRFCAGLALLADGPVGLDGDEAMRRRPMPGLLAALRALGAEVQELGRPSCPPIRVVPPGDLQEAPAHVALDPTGSSQQLSALLLAAPRLPKGLEVRLTASLPSRPYVDLTLEQLRAFGATVEAVPGPEGAPSAYRVLPGGLRARRYVVEGDHSSASYPLAAGYLTGQSVRVVNAAPGSVQGDRVFPDLLEQLSSPSPRTFELGDVPDIAPTLATCALFASGETRLLGLAHLRVKESDRLAVLARGFRGVGADVEELPDGLVVRRRPLRGGATLDPAGDHRMAMCFALLGLRLPRIQVSDPGCVTKSYPGFFEMLRRFDRVRKVRGGEPV